MEAVCLLLNEKEDWTTAKKVLGKINLLQTLKEYDKDNIPDKVISAIAPYIAMEEFTPVQIKKASNACTAMCMWVRAMHKYHEVATMVARVGLRTHDVVYAATPPLPGDARPAASRLPRDAAAGSRARGCGGGTHCRGFLELNSVSFHSKPLSLI